MLASARRADATSATFRVGVRVLLAAGLAGFVLGCRSGAEPKAVASAPPESSAQPGTEPSSARRDHDAGEPDDASSGGAGGLLDAIDREQPDVAPGMANILSDELDVSGTHTRAVVSGAANDTCIRVLFRSTAAVRGRLLADDGRELARTAGATERGLLGEGGPVCVRRGEGIKLEFSSAGDAHVGFCVWAAPAPRARADANGR